MSRVAVDHYLREIASGSGWGSMDVGGAYISVGPAGGVTEGYGFIASASNGNARYRYVTGLGMGDALIMGRWTADLAPVTGDYQVAVMGRVLSDQTNYQLRALVSATLGNIQLRLIRRTSGTTATIVDKYGHRHPVRGGRVVLAEVPRPSGRVRPLYAGASGGTAPRSRPRG